MGYRGSKSGNKPVKEQRADASSVYTVRCALVTMKVALRRNNSNLRLKITQYPRSKGIYLWLKLCNGMIKRYNSCLDDCLSEIGIAVKCVILLRWWKSNSIVLFFVNTNILFVFIL